MQSRNEPHAPDRGDCSPPIDDEVIVARARTLIADPEYPTAAIVEELADLLILQHSGSPGGK